MSGLWSQADSGHSSFSNSAPHLSEQCSVAARSCVEQAAHPVTQHRGQTDHFAMLYQPVLNEGEQSRLRVCLLRHSVLAHALLMIKKELGSSQGLNTCFGH